METTNKEIFNKLESILFALSIGIEDLRSNINDAKPLTNNAMFVLKLYREELIQLNKDTVISLEDDLMNIYKFTLNLAEHFESIVIEQSKGFEQEINEVYSIL